MKGLKVLKTFCFLYFSGVLACPTIDDKESTNEANAKEEDKETCNEIFAMNGMNYTSFHEGAAHGIHSLSLEEIRYFFKADAPEQNRIPSVNIDFRSENIIHFDAPLWGYEKRFDTWALKIMDWFMLNDQPYLFQNRANTLEKIAHQYHMHEIYEKAAVIYNDLVENPPNNVNGICACANDLTENGVMTQVVNIARQLKHFGGQSRSGRFFGSWQSFWTTPAPAPRQGFSFPTWVQGQPCQVNVYSRGGRGQPRCNLDLEYRKRSADIDDEEENTKALIDNYLANSTKETAAEIVTSSVSWKAGTLVGPNFDKWVPYAAMLTYSLPDEKGIKDFAHFIYCMLNHQ